MVLILMSLLLAQEPPVVEPAEPAPVEDAETPAPEAEDELTEEEFEGLPEIEVWDELEVRRKRAALMRAAKEVGYSEVIRKKGKIILRHAQTYHGEVVLYADGGVEVKRQPVQFEPVLAKGPAAWLTCIIPPLCLRMNGQLVSKRRYQTFESEAFAAIEEDVIAYQDAISDRAVAKKVHALPSELEALWQDGEHMPEMPEDMPTASYEDRRAMLFAFWDTRTETQWGDEVRRTVEAFIRGEVQSTYPYTVEELDRYEANRSVLRSFKTYVLGTPDERGDIVPVEATP